MQYDDFDIAIPTNHSRSFISIKSIYSMRTTHSHRNNIFFIIDFDNRMLSTHAPQYEYEFLFVSYTETCRIDGAFKYYYYLLLFSEYEHHIAGP